jgi:hypothetical protein
VEVGYLEFDSVEVQVQFVCFQDSISLVTLYPMLQIVHRITKPAEELTNSNPSFAYRQEITGLQRDSYKRVLLVSWGSIICIYSIYTEGVKTGKLATERIQYLKMFELVKYITWLSPSLICLYTVR